MAAKPKDAGTTTAPTTTAPDERLYTAEELAAAVTAATPKRDVRIVFTKPYTTDGKDVKVLKDGIVMANASIVNVPVPGLALHGIGVKQLANKTVIATWPATANGMTPVIGGIMVKLDEPTYDTRGRLVTVGMSRESARALTAFSDLIVDAWAAACAGGRSPFDGDGIPVGPPL